MLKHFYSKEKDEKSISITFDIIAIVIFAIYKNFSIIWKIAKRNKTLKFYTAHGMF